MSAALGPRAAFVASLGVFAGVSVSTFAITELLDQSSTTRWLMPVVGIGGSIAALALAGSFLARRSTLWTGRERHRFALACAGLAGAAFVVMSAIGGVGSDNWVFVIAITLAALVFDYIWARIVLHFVPAQSEIAAP